MFTNIKGVKDNSRRKGIRAAKKDKRRKEAIARQAAYNKLTLEQKLTKLDEGKFLANRQRKRLILTSVVGTVKSR